MSDESDVRVPTGARVSQGLYEQMKMSAKKNKRTIGAEMEVAFQFYLDFAGKGHSPASIAEMLEAYLKSQE